MLFMLYKNKMKASCPPLSSSFHTSFHVSGDLDIHIHVLIECHRSIIRIYPPCFIPFFLPSTYPSSFTSTPFAPLSFSLLPDPLDCLLPPSNSYLNLTASDSFYSHLSLNLLSPLALPFFPLTLPPPLSLLSLILSLSCSLPLSLSLSLSPTIPLPLILHLLFFLQRCNTS